MNQISSDRQLIADTRAKTGSHEREKVPEEGGRRESGWVQASESESKDGYEGELVATREAPDASAIVRTRTRTREGPRQVWMRAGWQLLCLLAEQLHLCLRDRPALPKLLNLPAYTRARGRGRGRGGTLGHGIKIEQHTTTHDRKATGQHRAAIQMHCHPTFLAILRDRFSICQLRNGVCSRHSPVEIRRHHHAV